MLGCAPTRLFSPFLRFRPMIGFELADAEGDFLLLFVDADHDCFEFPVRPRTSSGALMRCSRRVFGNVDRPSPPSSISTKRAVRNEVRGALPLTREPTGKRFSVSFPLILLGRLRPRLTALFFLVDSANDDSHLLCPLEEFAGGPRRPQVMSVMLRGRPCHRDR